jgi:antirestriction protein ArdC
MPNTAWQMMGIIAHSIASCGIIRNSRDLCRYRHKGHGSGAPRQLNRDLWGSFGSKKYAFEELVAETNAAFCCTWLSIVPTVRHADYIGSWLE